MYLIISYVFAHIIEAVILWLCMSQMYNNRYSQYITAPVIFAGHAVMFGALCICNNVYITTICSVIIYFVIIWGLYHVSGKTSLFWSVILTAVIALSELIVYITIQQLAGTMDVKSSGVTINLVVVCLSKVLYFILAEIMVLINRNSRHSRQQVVNDKSIIILMTSLIVSLMVFMTYYIVGTSFEMQHRTTAWMIVSSIGLVISDVLVLWLNTRINQKNAESEAVKLQLEKEKADAQYYRLAYEKNESLEILRHDMSNHLNTILNMGTDTDVKKYVVDIMDEYSIAKRTTFSNNNVLNGLVSQYMEMCKNDNINLTVDIRPDTVENIAPNDVVALFGNILSNAYEAVKEQKERKPSYIEIVVKRKDNLIIIIASNSCYRAPNIYNGRMLSTKKDHVKKHGYGMKSIERVVDRYHGSHMENYDTQAREFVISIMLLIESNKELY